MYQGITFGVILAVAIGTAIYYYLQGTEEPQYRSGGGRSYHYNPAPPDPPQRPNRSTSRGRRRRIADEDKCKICKANLYDGSAVQHLPCDHKFHASCFSNLLKSNAVCPLCFEDAEEELCVICYENLNKSSVGVKRLICDHKFHSRCIEPWLRLQKSCPVCRKET